VNRIVMRRLEHVYFKVSPFLQRLWPCFLHILTPL
jgi:hypothetical protein